MCWQNTVKKRPAGAATVAVAGSPRGRERVRDADGCSAVGFACACCEGREAARSHVRCRRHLRARAAAQPVQGVWRRWHLRARSAAQPVQGVRRRRHLRAWAASLLLQGLRRRRHLRAWAAAQPVQGVRRRQHLRARAAALQVQGLRRQQSRNCRARRDGGRS